MNHGPSATRIYSSKELSDVLDNTQSKYNNSHPADGSSSWETEAKMMIHRDTDTDHVLATNSSYRKQTEVWGDCQVSRLPESPDRDYVTRSRAPDLTTRLCPSAGGLRLVGRRRLGTKFLLLFQPTGTAFIAQGPTNMKGNLSLILGLQF